MDIGTPEIGQHPGHRDVPKGPSNTKRDHFGITKLDLAMTQGRKDLSNEQQRTTTSSKRAQRARSQTTKADGATNRPTRALSWGTKPIMRVLLYCFKPPLPSAAASPPPRRAVGPSALSSPLGQVDSDSTSLPFIPIGFHPDYPNASVMGADFPREPPERLQAGRQAAGLVHCGPDRELLTQPSRVRSAGLQPPLTAA